MTFGTNSSSKLAFTINEAANAAGIGRTKLYEIINSGELKARKHGKRTIILSRDLEEFLCGLEVISPKNGRMINE